MPHVHSAKSSKRWSRRARSPLAIPAAISVCFLLVGWLSVGDYGLTWDENELLNSVHSSPENVWKALRGEPVRWSNAELPAHGIALDLVRSAVLALFAGDGTFHGEVAILHAFHATLAAAALFLFARLVFEVSDDTRLTAFACAAFALTPQFIAHSQNNPKDLGALFTFVWALQALVQFTERRRMRDGVVASWALGLALATRVTSILVLPVFLAWALWRGTLRARSVRTGLAATFAGAGVVTVVLWPWLWRDTLGNLLWGARHVLHFWFDVPVQYLGQTYTSKSVPWHYLLVNLAAFTPLPMLALAAWGAWPSRHRGRDVRGLACCWFLVLLASDVVSSSHYDGVRHQLSILPSIAIEAALGVDRLLLLARRTSSMLPQAGPALAGSAALWILSWELAFHPYNGAYVNGVAKLVARGATEEFFPGDYWGASYKEGGAWLSTHAEPGARLFVTVAPHVAARYVPVLVEDVIPEDFAGSGAFYVMYITRVDSYSPELRALDARYCPVFTITRDDTALLKIVSHRSLPKSTCGLTCECGGD